MANAAARMFTALLDEKDMKYTYLDEAESIVRLGMTLENTTISIYYAFADDMDDVKVMGRSFITFPKDKIQEMYKCCNAVNAQYRWIKFYADEERKEIVAEYDCMIQLDTCARSCMGTMIRMAEIVDRVYKDFMKALWA